MLALERQSFVVNPAPCFVVWLRPLQHEYDHLDGTVYIDHLSPPEREKVGEKGMMCPCNEHVLHYQLSTLYRLGIGNSAERAKNAVRLKISF